MDSTRTKAFKLGPSLCIIRAINAVYGYVALDADKFQEYKAVFQAQLEEEIVIPDDWPGLDQEEFLKTSKEGIAKQAINTMGFGAEMNTLSYIIQDLDPDRFNLWICGRNQVPDDTVLADVDALILSSKTHCWAVKRNKDQWTHMETGKPVPDPRAAISGALKGGGIAILLWDQQRRMVENLESPSPKSPSPKPSISQLPIQAED